MWKRPGSLVDLILLNEFFYELPERFKSLPVILKDAIDMFCVKAGVFVHKDIPESCQFR